VKTEKDQNNNLLNKLLQENSVKKKALDKILKALDKKNNNKL